MKKHSMISLVGFALLLVSGTLLAQSRTSPPNFLLAGSPVEERVWPLGPSAHYDVTITPMNGFAGEVEFRCYADVNISCSVSPGSIVVGGELPTRQVVVRADTLRATRPGTYMIVITGTSRGISNSTVVELLVL